MILFIGQMTLEEAEHEKLAEVAEDDESCDKSIKDSATDLNRSSGTQSPTANAGM